MDYQPHIFDVRADLIVRVEAANEKHAKQKLENLFKDRITQYISPGEIRKDARVIGVMVAFVVYEPVRMEFERDSERPKIDPKKEGEKNTIPGWP